MTKKDSGNGPVVITTAHRGVFYGQGPKQAAKDKTIRITGARMCVYWSSDMKSVLGMAANGPSQGCRIGPAVKAITLTDVTSVIEVTDEAAKKFDAAPWG